MSRAGGIPVLHGGVDVNDCVFCRIAAALAAAAS